MFVRRSIRVAVLPALALCLTLAGCGGDEEIEPKMPETSSTTAASPTESSPTEPVEPTLPPEAEGDDAAAAEAFIEYYFASLNFAQATGETTTLRRLGLADCAACRGSLEAIESTYSAGGSIEGGVLTVTNLSASPGGNLSQSTRPFDARATVKSTRQVIRNSDNDELDGVYPASRIDLQLQLVHGPDGWLISEWSEVR